tara:strand:- start:94 stop:948 length:855 start_codon:yes stop_codon:yes gene_type:complete
MIFWIASYPKSGNTWIRTLISSYYYTEDGIFKESKIHNIDQFPQKKYFKDFKYDKTIVNDTARLWLKAQKKINLDKKLRFFKTHNAFGNLNGNPFTDNTNSIGAIYVVRDPRNVITSLKNHYELNDNQAYSWMINENNYLYDVHNFEDDGYSDFQFISSWSTNYKSWKVQKKIPIKIIKYEDLLNETYLIFKDLINFINIIVNNSEQINRDKLKKVIDSTLFDKLRKEEQDKGFTESVLSRDGKRKIPFFNLGPKNDWNKILNIKMVKKIEEVFADSMKDLSYK